MFQRMLRRLQSLIPAIVVAVIAATTAPMLGSASAASFLKAIADVPLMEGLSEAADPVVFESSRGRVITTRATGKSDAASVTKFYAAALPPLGWEKEGEAMLFRRGAEQLKVDVVTIPGDAPDPVMVNFELVVKLASVNLPE